MAHSRPHRWIWLGIALGIAWGWALHSAHYADFAAQARAAIPGASADPAVLLTHAKAIQKAVEAQMRETFFGGLAQGLAQLFLALLRMLVLPLVMASLISGIARMRDFSRLRTVGLKAGAWYLLTSFLAILTGLALVNAIGPGYRAQLPLPAGAVELPAPKAAWDMLLAVVPTNLFQALANFDMLAVIFFSLFFGAALLSLPEDVRDPVERFVESAFAVLMKMTTAVLAIAPLGIAALIASLVATTGPGVFVELAGYAATVASALALHAFVTLPLLFWALTRHNPFTVMRAVSPALLTALSTASSSGTLPLTMEETERRAGVPNRVAGFVLPLGATVNMDGTALYECVATLFVAQLFATQHPEFALGLGTQLTVVLLALVVSIGAAGIPHAGLVMMVIIFEAIGLPLELTALLWAVDRPLDMCRTAVNVWSDVMGATTVAHSEGDWQGVPQVAIADAPPANA